MAAAFRPSSRKGDSVFRIERQEQILNYINEKQHVKTQELAQAFDASLVTIRNDINELAKRGLVIKTHGGAVCCQHSPNMEIPSVIRFQENIESKQAIASLAVQLIEDGDVIILDSGSTTLEIARRITAQNVTVITDDIKIAVTLADRGGISLMMTGGTLLPSVYTLVGAQAINFIRTIRVKKLFLGCDAIDFEWGISNRTMEEIQVKDAMIHAAHEVIAVADCSKFNRQVFARLCGMEALNTLITDRIEPDVRERLESLGLRVLTPA